ncbi:MAG: hypothetical protein IJ634_07680 [Bacteroidales bacterium]|nr:hypothetical protein [Bacteroidales bacterium]
MCTVTLNINEAQVRRINPALTDMDAITRWAQRIIDNFIADHRSQEELTPYTLEELNARIDESERQFAEGKCKSINEVFRRWDMDVNMVAEEESEYGAV